MSEELEHIQQRAPEGDCGVCCIALFLNQSYDKVYLKSVASDVIPYGLVIAELVHVIKKRSNIDASVTTYNRDAQTLARYEFPKEPAIYGVVRPEAGHVWHYVFSDGTHLYDPLLSYKINLIQAKADYHSGWVIMAMVK